MGPNSWQHMFKTGESPYFAMFRAGCMGVPLEDCTELCSKLMLPLRKKDVQSWVDGHWKHQTRTNRGSLNPVLKRGPARFRPEELKFTDLAKWPEGWQGTEKRWFPCSVDNMPMGKWGYKEGEPSPVLYDRPTAIMLSPSGLVGQNLYAQPFIVLDIDGVGHGARDEQVIEFGTKYRSFTETWENPAKQGSFHLYFATDRIVPIAHYGHAKLDVMGNEKNAAVYTKAKQSNGLPRLVLDEEIWEDIKEYQARRKN